jgi:hypothetical protein
MKRLMTLLISSALILGSAGLVTAQSQTAQESDNDSIKKPAKDVGHDTKRAAKATGKKVKKTTKKVVHKGAEGARKGAEKVEDKTETTK